MSDLLTTYEIGSMAKPEWRVKAILGKPITDTDIQLAKDWAKKLNIECDPLIDLLNKAKSADLTKDDKNEIKRWASHYILKMFEGLNVDVVYDGEQQRSEMYHQAITQTDGFEFRGHVRSFDNKYYNIAACVNEPAIQNPFHIDEFKFAQSVTKADLKVPITGAYTLADWSYDEYFAGKHMKLGSKMGREAAKEARREFLLSLARNVVRPNIEALIAAGANYIQIDEPAVTTQPDELPLFVESYNESVRGLDCKFIIHFCFSDYNLLFPHVDNLENCWGFCIGFSNDDKTELGTNDADRPGLNILKRFAALNNKFHIGVGVFDIHRNFIEPPELIADRIRYANKVLGAEYVNPCPDCGLRTRSWDVSYEKLKNMSEATNIVRREING